MNLSRQKDFRGIQDVLVKEINNSDSRKYAILTTTDSFYRYKEAVKELLDRNLQENDMSRLKLLRELEEVRQKKMKDEENAGKVKDPKKTDEAGENKRTAAGTGGGNVRGSGRYADTNRKAV